MAGLDVEVLERVRLDLVHDLRPLARTPGEVRADRRDLLDARDRGRIGCGLHLTSLLSGIAEIDDERREREHHHHEDRDHDEDRPALVVAPVVEPR